MGKNNVIELVQSGEFTDHLTEVLRQGAQNMILEAVEAEIEVFLNKHLHKKLEDGRQQIVRYGHLPERKIITALGPISVEVPRARDRLRDKGGDQIQFSSQLLPSYVRHTKSVEMAIPYLYLKGISSGDFGTVLPILFGKDSVGMSADTVLRLRNGWQKELDLWLKRRLDSKHYVYI